MEEFKSLRKIAEEVHQYQHDNFEAQMQRVDRGEISLAMAIVILNGGYIILEGKNEA